LCIGPSEGGIVPRGPQVRSYATHAVSKEFMSVNSLYYVLLYRAMVSSCSAYGCTARYQTGNQRRFHCFPSNPDLRKRWIVSLRRANWTPGRTARICSDHFTAECYDRSKPWLNKLKPDAVPTIFDFPAHLQPKVNCRMK